MKGQSDLGLDEFFLSTLTNFHDIKKISRKMSNEQSCNISPDVSIFPSANKTYRPTIGKYPDLPTTIMMSESTAQC